jgi:hypothetical protein
MEKRELEALLQELDDALAQAFPGPEPMSMLVVGGACLLFQNIITRQTTDIDVIIFEMMGSEETTLIFHTPVADTIRSIITKVGMKHGLAETHPFLNDDASSFLLEMSENELPPMRLFRAYRKLRLYVPDNLRYILACKLLAARPEKDLDDIAALCQALAIQTKAQAQRVVDEYFPSIYHQALHQLPRTLHQLFES